MNIHGKRRWWARYATWPVLINRRIVWLKWYEYEVQSVFEHGIPWKRWYEPTGRKRAIEQPVKLDRMKWPR